MEGKQSSPSVIARLMGLDEHPPQQPLPAKQQRVLSENYLQKTASLGLREKSSFCVGLSPGINNQKHQVVKNVCGVEFADTSSQEKASQNAAKLKMQKRTDSRFSSTKKKKSCFKAPEGISEGLPSDNLPRYSQLANQFSTKQLHDLQASQSIKLFREIGKRSARSTAKENTLRSLQALGIVRLKDYVGECAIHHFKEINSQFDPKANMIHPSTRMIVLKPSTGKSENTKSQSFSLGPGLKAHPVDLEYKDTSGAESISDSLKLPSSNLFCKRKGDDTPFSFSKRPSFSKEAKKQIIERWKPANDLQEVEIASRSQSLKEMLATADLETRPQFSDSKRDKYRCCNSFSAGGGILGSCNPLGISSKEGWKDEDRRSSPMPNHSVGSRIVSGSTEGLTGNKASLYGWCLRQKVAVAEKNFNSMNQKQKDSMEYRDFRRSSMHNKYSDSTSPCISSIHSPTVDANEMMRDDIRSTLKKSDPYRGSKHGSNVSEHSARGLTSTLVNANAENSRSFHRMFDDIQAEPIPCDTHYTSVGQQSWTDSSQRRSLSAKHNRTDPESPQNLKETDQRSPNSVLGAPFEEKLCTSEIHDSCAGLCSVAMQLQFLETNSEETYSAGSEMGVSSDEDSERGSLDLFQDSENILKIFKTEEARDLCYLVDVLDEASLHGMNLEMSFKTWHSLECPVNQSVFDSLEKKYGKQQLWLKSERKLLFDRINSGLSKILHSFMDIYNMEISLKRRCSSTLRRNDVEEELWKMLISQKNEVHKDLSGKVIGNETKWLQVEEEIGSICREIENFLFDELAAELACVERV